MNRPRRWPPTRSLRLALGLLVALAAPTAGAGDGRSEAPPGDAAQLLQTVDYVAVDYPEAVARGEVVDAGEFEEMREFTARVRRMTASEPELAELARILERRVLDKAPAAAVADAARELRSRLLARGDVAVTPRRTPDPSLGAELYARECAGCHGAEGRGDGPAARGLTPPPTDFTDPARAAQRSVYGLYNTITLGVDGTSMPAFGARSDHERWSLAFHVASLQDAPAERQRGAELHADARVLDLEDVATRSEAELRKQHADAAARLAYLRAEPAALFEGRDRGIPFARRRLEESLDAFAAGRQAEARRLALSAYLDGFEPVEPALSSADAELMRTVERRLAEYRRALEQRAPDERVRAAAAAADDALGRAADALERGVADATAAGTASFTILAREGLEAILLLAALAAVIRRTGDGAAMRYLHVGWIGALALGAATWALATWLIDFSGAGRELTEGITALLAAAILYWVGFWMHQQISSRNWAAYMAGRIHGALASGSRWVVAVMAFVAVYREVFETILFYQALWAQVGTSGRTPVVVGALAAVALLVVAAWAILRLGARLPLKQFFAGTAAILVGLALVFAGKGIAALQEAGYLRAHPLNLPEAPVLGIHSTLEGLALQLALLALALWLVLGRRPARSA